MSGLTGSGNFLSILFLNLIRIFLSRAAVFIVKTVFKSISWPILYYWLCLLLGWRYVFLILTLQDLNLGRVERLFLDRLFNDLLLFVTPLDRG